MKNPPTDVHKKDMHVDDFTEEYNYFSQFITEQRMQKIEKVLHARTRYITVVLEDIYQPHNASAVIRTCEGLGIQDVHIIENRNTYRVNPGVVLGTSKWITLKQYNQTPYNTLQAIQKLRNQGYRIVAASSHAESLPLHNFDIQLGKRAIFFGNELEGLTDKMISQADENIYIPMYGFVESFNISVAAAIVLDHLVTMLRKSNIFWRLNTLEKQELKLTWIKKSISNVRVIENEFLRKKRENR